MAPATLASSSAPAVGASSSEANAIPHFEKRNGPPPEIHGMNELVGTLNAIARPHQQVVQELRDIRKYFAGVRAKGEQTKRDDGKLMKWATTPILRSENERNPGLNAIAVRHQNRMVDILKIIARGGQDEEGHVRFHLGLENDTHRVAVDAYKHREGGFTLITVDSVDDVLLADELGNLRKRNPKLIKGIMSIPTHNQVHNEGCRVFAMHALNGMHDYQPYFQNLHRKIYDKERGRPAPELAEPRFERSNGVYMLESEFDAYGLLPGKFFKHMQVKPPYEGERPGEKRTYLDDAEDKNPALRDQPVNKKGQTLRERYASLNPGVPSEAYSRADRTSSIDEKRLVFLDRAVVHYDSLAGQEQPNAGPSGSRPPA